MVAEAKIKVTAQGRVVTTKPLYGGAQRPHSGGYRNSIYRFSRASRKRFIELVNRLIIPEQNLFVTLTYGQFYPRPLESKKHLDVFTRWLSRNYDNKGILWRLEPQARGAPHYHLMILGIPFIDFHVIAMKWAETIGHYHCDHSEQVDGLDACARPPFVWVERCDTPQKVLRYVAKYCAKAGKRAKTGQKSVLLDSVAYFVSASGEILKCGRLWGVINRKALPFAIIVETIQTFKSRVFWRLRWDMSREYYPILHFNKFQGFTLLTDAAYDWIPIAAYYSHAMTS